MHDAQLTPLDDASRSRTAECGQSTRRLVVFDLDHTVLSINSHYHFAESFLQQRAPLLHKLYGLLTAGFLGKVLGRVVGCDARKWVSLRCFGWFPQETLDNSAQDVFAELHQTAFNQNIVQLLESFRERDGYHVVLMSATPDFIARPMAQRLGIDYFASTYHHGRLVADLTGRKLERAAAIPNVVPELFVSDNPEDINTVFPNYLLVKDGVMYRRCNSISKDECP